MQTTTSPEAGERTQSTYEIGMRDIEDQRKALEGMKDICDTVDEVRAMFPQMTSAAFVAGMGVCVDFRQVRDLRDMVPIGAEFIRRGYHPCYTILDDPENRTRRYFYSRNKWKREITVFASIAREGAKCEFKQVGVKEQPVYEIVCT